MRSVAAVQKNDWLGISWRRPKLVKTWLTTADKIGRCIKDVEEMHSACTYVHFFEQLSSRTDTWRCAS